MVIAVNLEWDDFYPSKFGWNGLQQTPIYIYSSDHQNEDFQDCWYWAYLPNEEYTGPEYRPFLGKQQLLDPHIKESEYFFNETFSPSNVWYYCLIYELIRNTKNSMERYFISFILYPEQRDHEYFFWHQFNKIEIFLFYYPDPKTGKKTFTWPEIHSSKNSE